MILVLAVSFFSVVAVVMLVRVRELWRLDVDELDRRYPRFGSFFRGLIAATPALLAGCCVMAIGGGLVILGDHGVRPPFAVRVAFGAVYLGVVVLAISAAYLGRPRWAEVVPSAVEFRAVLR